jgi:hypothetical protein
MPSALVGRPPRSSRALQRRCTELGNFGCQLVAAVLRAYSGAVRARGVNLSSKWFAVGPAR